MDSKIATALETSPVGRESVQADRTPGSNRKPSLTRKAIAWLIESIPTVIVMAALAGIAYWGHHNDWKVPKFSELTGTAPPPAEAWCAEHNVPESECIQCIPSLAPDREDHGWCKEHGVHQCILCNPEVAELKTTPAIDDDQFKSAEIALAARDRQENNQGCTLYRNRVQFTSHDSAMEAGIDVEPVETASIVESIPANGEITYDETRVAHLSSRVPGTIWKVFKNVGDRVRKGDVLALIDSAEVGKAKSALLDALAEAELHSKTVARIAPLYQKQIVTGSRMTEAQTALEQANIQVRQSQEALSNLGLRIDVNELRGMSQQARSQRLRHLGLTNEVHATLDESTSSANLIPLVASLDGVVTFREAVPGEVVNSAEMLFQLADTNSMWLRLNVALEDAKYVSEGQEVRFTPDGTQDEVTGHLSWISTNVDQQTRTLEVRADVANPAGLLRHETFGKGDIILRKAETVSVVPKEAVQWDGSCFVVFVRDKNYFDKDQPKVFHTRTVRPGVTEDGKTEIIVGVLPGEIVATKGSGVLRSQILKNNLGAGCTCGH
jgi:multidrug efflux pump subunit AcrA (membrane-fusion protein)